MRRNTESAVRAPRHILAVPVDNAQALGALLTPAVYEQLRGYARGLLRRERLSLGLEPSDVLDESLLRILREFPIDAFNPIHVIALAKQGMRHFLVDLSRKRGAGKRGGAHAQRSLENCVTGPPPGEETDAAVAGIVKTIVQLTAKSARLGKIARLHLLGNLTFEDTARVLGIFRTTVTADWTIARRWLVGALRSVPLRIESPHPQPATDRG